MDTVSVSEFASLVGVTTRTVSDLAKRGVIQKSGAGFAWPGELKKYCGHLREQAAGRGGAAASEVASERAALLRLQRERAQFEFAQQKKEYISWDESEQINAAIMSACRAAVLTITERISPSLGPRQADLCCY
jgi:phage terminase Nu1 subunit (DNA packaging protein)